MHFAQLTNKQAFMKKLLIASLLALLPLIGVADTLYVGDTLRVGVRPEPNKSLPSIAVVRTGAELELLQRRGSFTKIRTKAGVEGWVTSAYLSKNSPSVKKLKDAQIKIRQLEKKTSELQKNLQPRNDGKSEELETVINTLQQEKQKLLAEVEQLKLKPVSVSAGLGNGTNKITLDLKESNLNFVYIVLGTIVVILCLGFLFGVSWHKKQVTKRLGGLSI